MRANRLSWQEQKSQRFPTEEYHQGTTSSRGKVKYDGKRAGKKEGDLRFGRCIIIVLFYFSPARFFSSLLVQDITDS